MGRLVIDGNSVYELDEECIRAKEKEEREKRRKEKGRQTHGKTGRHENRIT